VKFLYNYKLREISEALKTLEKAILIYLIYPSTGQNFLENYFAGKEKSFIF